MRALIRADLHPAEKWIELWNSDQTDYDKHVVKLFERMGYAAIETEHDKLVNNRFIKEIIKDMPQDIKDQETKHLIMLGYTSEGQSHFIVSGVNPTEIHIRIKGGLLGRLVKACVDIQRNAFSTHGTRSTLTRRIFRSQNEQQDTSLHLTIRSTIEVMEPKRDHPTIVGEIIESARKEVFRKSTYELALIWITLSTAVLLFLATPTLAPSVQKSLASVGLDFTPAYIQGALERIYSAFLVTCAVTTMGLSFRILEIRRQKPIVWNSNNGQKERL